MSPDQPPPAAPGGQPPYSPGPGAATAGAPMPPARPQPHLQHPTMVGQPMQHAGGQAGNGAFQPLTASALVSAEAEQAFAPSPPPPPPNYPQPIMPPTAQALQQPGMRAKQPNPNSTQNSLLVAEVRDGIVIMNDGSFRSVVMVKSINFDLMSPQEQEAVEYSYQSFLNSLYFPIQIFIRSQKVDLQPYIEKLDKIRTEHENMLLALMMEEYIDFMDRLAQQTNIMDKKFYIVIPFFPHLDVQKALTQSKNFLTGLTSLLSTKEQHVVINEADLNNAKTELRNRVQAVLSGLIQCGIQGLPLDTQELIELFYDTYNPDTATRQQLKNFNDLTADIVTKGQGTAAQAHLQRELQ